MHETRIGISGWTYPPWRGKFYPKKLPQKDELRFASRALNSIEINGTFYSLQRPSSYKSWYAQTPDEFVFAVKGGRFITHMKRLKDIDAPLANFLASGLLLLKQKLGPILWQFPPNFPFDQEKFSSFFELLPHDTHALAKLARKHDKRMTKEKRWLEADERRRVRHAVEIRHESFRDDKFLNLLKRHNIALVLADTARQFPMIEEVTADFVYARLHGDEELYASGYSEAALDDWAKRLTKLREKRDLYVYFDNDIKVHAPFDAMSLSRRMGLDIDFEQLKRDAAYSGRSKRQRDTPRPKWGN
jgi:uncharacterized protein YecE (DUF72 family)